MYKRLTQCDNWDEILNLIIKLINENEQLKAEKQQLVNEVMNLKLQNKQNERRKERRYTILISEME